MNEQMEALKASLNKVDKALENILTGIDECNLEERQELAELVDKAGFIQDMRLSICSMSIRLAARKLSFEGNLHK